MNKESLELQSPDGFWDSLKILQNQHWVANGLEIQGDVRFRGVLRFNGHFKGQLLGYEEESVLFQLSDSKIEGRIEVNELIVAGQMNNVDIVSRSVRILKGAQVFGTIRSQELVIEEGAIFQGQSERIK